MSLAKEHSSLSLSMAFAGELSLGKMLLLYKKLTQIKCNFVSKNTLLTTSKYNSG